MAIALKALSEQIIVITGASSGIGLATAKAAAAKGARVVLASRNGAALAQAVQEITAAGGRATYTTTDVGNREEIEALADFAIREYGGFDTWINNAGLSIFGKLEEITPEDHEKLFQTNFWGVVNGSLVALKHLKSSGGKLINLGSEVSDVAVPMQGMYSVSKHAIKGFTDALRMELEIEKAPVSVTLIKPAAINTPFTQHAKNYMNEEPKLPAPVYAVTEVANAILHATTHDVRDIYIGGGSRVMSAINKIAPGVMDWIGHTLPQQQKRGERPKNPAGSLYQAGSDGETDGDHPGYVMKTSFYTRASMHPLLTGALVAAGAIAAVTLLSED